MTNSDIDDIVCQRLRLKIFRVGLKQPLASYSKDTCLVLVLFRELRSFPPGHNLSKGCLYVGVSKNSGFSPQIIHFNRVFHYKPSILRYPYFWKHPCFNILLWVYD